MLVLTGCTDTAARKQLDEGNQALNARHYDMASDDADAYLRKHSTGTDAAEAYYLKGRIFEQRAFDPAASPSVAVKRENLDAARGAYNAGIAQHGTQPVQALLHSGAANVAFFEDDEATALREWQIAYDNFQNDDARAWTLFRVGICQQRLGQFSDADQTFQRVQQSYPGTEPAKRAMARYGIHAFYVQLVAFTDPSRAQSAANALKAQGLAASTKPQAGEQIVQLGPFPAYPQARTVQARLLGQYRGAVIVP